MNELSISVLTEFAWKEILKKEKTVSYATSNTTTAILKRSNTRLY